MGKSKRSERAGRRRKRSAEGRKTSAIGRERGVRSEKGDSTVSRNVVDTLRGKGELTSSIQQTVLGLDVAVADALVTEVFLWRESGRGGSDEFQETGERRIEREGQGLTSPEMSWVK